MADPFVAEIRIFPFNFAPKGWAFCDGQLLPLSQNTALFSLLGTTYGGNGKSNFAIPDLQGNAPMHPGQGPGLSDRDLGETGGSDTVSLLGSEMPSHPHDLVASLSDGLATQPAGQQFAQGVGVNIWGTNPVNAMLAGTALAETGLDAPHNNMQPYLTLNFCIALQGIFPARS
jgi:microcystin-dependent protein